MRKILNCSISFGLVNVPVGIYLAAADGSPAFHLLCGRCHTRIQTRLWCPACDAAVARSEAVRGVEVARDQYAIVTDAELDELPVPTKRTISIEQFVKADEARSVTRFCRAAYYLEPEPLGILAYALLRNVLAEHALLAIGKITLRERERLAAIEPFGRVLLLTTLAWPDEIRSVAELDLPDDPAIPARERRVAGQLAAAMTETFEPAAYRDGHRIALDALIEGKSVGSALVGPSAAETTAPLIDLMAALEASMANARAARIAPVPVRRRRRPVNGQPGLDGEQKRRDRKASDAA